MDSSLDKAIHIKIFQKIVHFLILNGL